MIIFTQKVAATAAATATATTTTSTITTATTIGSTGLDDTMTLVS